MGQAKKKGSLELRKKQAFQRLRDQLPDSIKCNDCGEDLTEIIPLQAKYIDGVNGMGFAVCPKCDKVTFGFDTTINHAQDLCDAILGIEPDVLYPMLEATKNEYEKVIKSKEKAGISA